MTLDVSAWQWEGNRLVRSHPRGPYILGGNKRGKM